MENNPQNTISTTAIKQYNDYRSVRVETLEWLKLTSVEGQSTIVSTERKLVENEVLDYIKIDIMKTTTKLQDQECYISAAPDIKQPQYTSELLIPPTTNHAFSKNEELDDTIVHRRLGHATDDKINKMAKLEIMLDLPKRKSQRYRKQKCRCVICWKASTVNLPNVFTIDTTNIRPGELIHIDFCFLEETSIRNFTCTIVIVDARVRKMWTFLRKAKDPIGYSKILLRANETDGNTGDQHKDGYELARSSKFCNLLVEEIQCGLQTTSWYSSWLMKK